MTVGATVRKSARAAVAVGWTGTMLAAVETHKLLDRRLTGGLAQDTVFEAYMRVWTGGLLKLTNVQVVVSFGGERLAPGTEGCLPRARGPRLVVSNHRSALDIPVLLTHFGGSVLSRGDLEKWPLLGLAAQKAQTIFVDRADSRSGANAIRQIREQLKRGRTVSVFPEGTTFPGDEVRPFNRGALSALRGLDVEVLPVGIAYPTGSEFVERSFLEHASAIAERPRTLVSMAVGAPFAGGELASSELATSLREQVQALVLAARAALPAS